MSQKASQLVKNLSNLQAEYDTVQDKVEEQAAKIKALEQDLAKSLQVRKSLVGSLFHIDIQTDNRTT